MTPDPLRRYDTHRMTPVELKVAEALDAVEELGADERLSDAVELLSKARNRVADFIDGV